MQKKYIPVALLFALLLVFFAHFGARMNAVPTFTYADEQKKVYLKTRVCVRGGEANLFDL